MTRIVTEKCLGRVALVVVGRMRLESNNSKSSILVLVRFVDDSHCPFLLLKRSLTFVSLSLSPVAITCIGKNQSKSTPASEDGNSMESIPVRYRSR